jgi:hypothetical protein
MILPVYSREEASRQRAAAVSRARARPEQEEPHAHLLDLQRQFGNTAVTRLVQRAPHDRPASTDAPGAKHPGHAPAKPAPKKVEDIHARVIKFEIDQDMGYVTIGSGPDQGVEVGMPGSLVMPNGTEYADFTVEKAEGRVSKAHVKAIADQVNAGPEAIIKASKFKHENLDDKEF